MRIYYDPKRNIEGYMDDTTYLVGVVRGAKRTLAELPIVASERLGIFHTLQALGEIAWVEIHTQHLLVFNGYSCLYCGKGLTGNRKNYCGERHRRRSQYEKHIHSRAGKNR